MSRLHEDSITYNHIYIYIYIYIYIERERERERERETVILPIVLRTSTITG